MKEEGELKERLAKLVRIAGSQREFARIVEITNPAVVGWMKGVEPHMSNLSKIAQKTGVALEWLAHGAGHEETELRKFRHLMANLGDAGSATEKTEESALLYGAAREQRLDPRLQEKLNQIARHNGDLDPSQLLRWAIEQMIKYAERNKGRLLLPIDFGEKVASAVPIDPFPKSEAPLREMFNEPKKVDTTKVQKA